MNTLQYSMYTMLGLGMFFNTIGIIGLLRFPDVYTRLHAETKTTTLGAICTTTAVIIFAINLYLNNHDPSQLTLAIHSFIAVLILAFTNATGSHAIARAAYRQGQKPVDAVVNHLEDSQTEKGSES